MSCIPEAILEVAIGIRNLESLVFEITVFLVFLIVRVDILTEVCLCVCI